VEEKNALLVALAALYPEKKGYVSNLALAQK
jgi:hypothetical protein